MPRPLIRALVILAVVALSIVAIIFLKQLFEPAGVAVNQPTRQNAAISSFLPIPPTASSAAASPGSSGDDHSQPSEWEDAMRKLTQAIQANPNDTAALSNRAQLWLLGGDADKAIADLGEIIRLNPGDAGALGSRANLRFAKGDLDGALADLTEVIRLKPGEASGYSNRGFVWYHKGDLPKSLSDLNEAVRLNPDDAGAQNNLAWVLATCPTASVRDGKRAVAAATKACELTQWNDWHSVGTLAAACAESGDFDGAVKYQKQAMVLPGVTDRAREEMEQRLALYILHQPAHEAPKR